MVSSLASLCFSRSPVSSALSKSSTFISAIATRPVKSQWICSIQWKRVLRTFVHALDTVHHATQVGQALLCTRGWTSALCTDEREHLHCINTYDLPSSTDASLLRKASHSRCFLVISMLLCDRLGPFMLKRTYTFRWSGLQALPS